MRVYLVFPAVVALLLLLGATALRADAARGVDEVRIVAAMASDGRVEFALERLGPDGAWGERELPRRRFFPADSVVGRWLVSTPLSVRAPGAGDGDVAVEVRITARLVPSGRVEFALQRRESGGAWGERQLPRQRFFPVASDATVGRWLVSTPLRVDGAGVASDRAALVAFYNATGGSSWYWSSWWLADGPLDEWHGVSTNAAGRVTVLNLSLNDLTGVIPPELGALSHLRELYLFDNDSKRADPA